MHRHVTQALADVSHCRCMSRMFDCSWDAYLISFKVTYVTYVTYVAYVRMFVGRKSKPKLNPNSSNSNSGQQHRSTVTLSIECVLLL